ncbi:Nup133 N terminal like-domain-containing protein [Chytridium lagenaria]|nr:Nup133 N terminal like-domain-containing protein [Chytridium lagenaria]
MTVGNLQQAAKVLDSKLLHDRSGDLIDVLKKGKDYQKPDGVTPFLIRERSMALPDTLYEQYDVMESRCFIGVFPEIQRAWISIDTKLYLWNYETREDIQIFGELDQVIISVGLVKPKPGVFLDQIDYVLVIATPIDITLVAMSASKSDGTGIKLYGTDISVSSDNDSIASIVGTDEGRIFMLATNGRIFELKYQPEDGWVSRKCRKVDLTASTFSHFIPTSLGGYFNSGLSDPVTKIAVDNERHILYALSKKSAIEVFNLGASGLEFKSSFKLSDIVHQAQKTLEMANSFSTSYLDPRKFEIVSLHPVSKSESKHCTLIALTNSGFRLYFSQKSVITGQSHGVSPTLCLQFVQPPPPLKERYRVHDAAYSKGVLVLANSVDEERDSLICVSSNKFSHEEEYGLDKLDGKVWNVVVEDSVRKDTEFDGEAIGSSRRFLVLTNTGVTVFKAKSPLEILKQLLEECVQKGGNTQNLQSFRARFNEEHIAFLCLALVCSVDSDATKSRVSVKEYAKRLFYGSWRSTGEEICSIQRLLVVYGSKRNSGEAFGRY